MLSISLRVTSTKDGEIVSCHDATLDRVSTGTGKIYEQTYEEIKSADFGVSYTPALKGLKIVRFEEILQKFAGHVIMNIHVKPLWELPVYDETTMKQIVDMVRRYDCERHVYFMLERDQDIQLFQSYAPDIAICVGHDDNQKWDIVDRAIRLGAQKVQLFKPYYNREMIEKAHAHGIKCNIFWADDPQEALHYLDMGVDTILTNDYLQVSQVLKDR